MHDRDLDLFRIDEKGDAIWLAAVADLEAAKELTDRFPAHTSFLIYNSLTQSKLFIRDGEAAEERTKPRD